MGESGSSCASVYQIRLSRVYRQGYSMNQTGVRKAADLILDDICPSIVDHESALFRHLLFPLPVYQPVQVVVVWHTHRKHNAV